MQSVVQAIERINGAGESLSHLAKSIDREHAAAESTARTALEHAVNAGKMLAEAKAAVGHGGWAGWVADNCRFSLRTAQVYMRLAANAGELANAQTTALLTIANAVKSLATDDGDGGQGDDDDPPPWTAAHLVQQTKAAVRRLFVRTPEQWRPVLIRQLQMWADEIQRGKFLSEEWVDDE